MFAAWHGLIARCSVARGWWWDSGFSGCCTSQDALIRIIRWWDGTPQRPAAAAETRRQV